MSVKNVELMLGLWEERGKRRRAQIRAYIYGCVYIYIYIYRVYPRRRRRRMIADKANRVDGYRLVVEID